MSVEPRDSSKLLWGIIGALVTVVILVFAYQWFNASTPQETGDPEPATVTPSKAKTGPASQPAPVAKAAPAETVIPLPTTETTEAVRNNALVKEDILKAPVPENPALAKEEVSRLEDLQSQLADQQTLLDAQHKDADKLIKLKEEQIKLLEAQLTEKP